MFHLVSPLDPFVRLPPPPPQLLRHLGCLPIEELLLHPRPLLLTEEHVRGEGAAGGGGVSGRAAGDELPFRVAAAVVLAVALTAVVAAACVSCVATAAGGSGNGSVAAIAAVATVAGSGHGSAVAARCIK